MRRTRMGAGAKSLQRGSTFARRTGGPRRTAGPRSRQQRRSPAERELAIAWHDAVSIDAQCVVCSNDAGPFGHHALPKSWLREEGLAAHRWDLEIGVPICVACHDRHERAVRRITRADLIRARSALIRGSLWEQLVAWCRAIDAAYFPGREPLLSRLEATHPTEVPMVVTTDELPSLSEPDQRILDRLPAADTTPLPTASAITRQTGMLLNRVLSGLASLRAQALVERHTDENGTVRWSLAR